MNKFKLILVFSMFCASSLLHAQTLKNIHRKNLPTLHIPSHLIEKVETVLDNNVRKLKVTQTSGFVSLIPTADIDSITHSEGQAVNPEQLGNLRTGRVFGVVRNDQGNPVPLALVKSAYSPHQTYTDVNGVFFLNDFVVYDKLGFITVEKLGYFKGSRSFLPLENGANRVEIQLLPKTQSGSFNSSSGGQITAGSLQLTFPANAIVQANGQAYTGTVNVFASALDPSAQEMFDQMPGDLLGGLNDSLRLLRSFGMAAVELFGSNNEPLQLANGQNATLRFTIPASLLSEAPESIDWWSFDEEAGYWKHEGNAQKTGNDYVGQASHFSWWNLDRPQVFVEMNSILYNIDGNPIGGALVEIVTLDFGTGIRYTNAEGAFTGRVPKNQNLTINIKLTCNTTNEWILVYSEVIQTNTTSINYDIYSSNLENRYPIMGTILNCNNQPVQSGYVRMGSQIFITNNGQYLIQVCDTGTYSLRGYDISDHDSIKVSDLLNIQVNSNGAEVFAIVACVSPYGTIDDVDGNLYQTILIGNQKWMAENLKTSRFADGSLIQNITDSTLWTQLSSPAWCNYENNAQYDAIYGKLYNWFTVADQRNVCPINWHVPSNEEWLVLINFLGSQGIAGGSMKSTIYWQAPNIAATNESGFSGFPSGGRSGNNGSFNNISIIGYWWSSQNDNLESAKTVNLRNDSDNAFNYSINKRYGLSIRCIED